MKHPIHFPSTLTDLIPLRHVLVIGGALLMNSLSAQVLIDESFTGGASTTGFTIESVDSDCDWIYAPGGLTENAFNQDFGGELPTGPGFDGDFAFIDSDECGASGITVNTFLVSPAFDASPSGTYRLAFSHQFRARLESFARVEVFNGTDWSEVAYWTAADRGYPNPAATEQIDITTATGGSALAQVRFQFSAGWDWWWAIDAITVSRLNCLSPMATTTLIEDCANGQFSVSVDVSDLGDASSVEVFANGGSAGTLSAPGAVVAGPFPSLTDVDILVAHTDPLCDLSLPTVTYNCGPCVNIDLYPEDTIAVEGTGLPELIAGNMYAGSEYNALSGMLAGSSYEIVHENGAYITVHEATFDGPVVGEGYSPLTVVPMNSVDHFVHYTVDDQCNTDPTGSWDATIQLLLVDCEGNLGGPALPGTACEDGGTPGLWTVDCVCDITAGISESEAGALRLYPNPANHQLTIALSSTVATVVRVLDMLGHAVLEQRHTGAMDVSELAKGSYIVQVTDAHGEVIARARFNKN